jgi:ketosteroid isomerase-like protein
MPAEEALREALGSMQVAIDARDGRALQGWLADDFVGPEGLDRAGAQQLARASFMRYRKVGLTLTPARIELLGDHATVRFEAAVTGGSGRMLPDATQVYEVETGWRREGGDWRMTSARWSPKL